MSAKSPLRMFLAPFVSFCASACFQISGFLKEINENDKQTNSSDLIMIFFIAGVIFSSARIGYCLGTGCWDNINYDHPSYYLLEYISMILNGATIIKFSKILQIIALASSIISLLWNLIHALQNMDCQYAHKICLMITKRKYVLLGAIIVLVISSFSVVFLGTLLYFDPHNTDLFTGFVIALSIWSVVIGRQIVGVTFLCCFFAYQDSNRQMI